MSEYILELTDIVKRFPGVTALNHVKFQLKKGEIHALMGENGAGKSTFIKIITGVYEPDEGTIMLNGEVVKFRNPLEASRKSIAAIYQHSTAYPFLTVAENIFVGHYKTRKGIVDWKSMYQETEELLQNLGCSIDPRARMGSLTVAEQQIVEIAKAVSTKAKILIMDEPTAALSERECEQFYRIVEALRDNGTSIIFISHRIKDMYRLASRVTVLRDAEYIGTYEATELPKEQLITAMVGRQIISLYPKREVPIGENVLEVEGLSRAGYFENISFSVHKGEILGFTGLVGAGRTEVFQAICGINKFDKGTVKLEGKHVKFTHPKQAIEAGIGYLPEDRQVQGLILSWEIFRNETLATIDKYASFKGMDIKREKQNAKEHSENLGIKVNNVMDRVDSLSGGNQQKVVVAKLLDSRSKLLILDEPTKGVDVGAKAQIYEIIMELVEQGYAVVLISSEMPEILSMSDRIAIMANGKLINISDAKDMTQEKILSAAMHISEKERKEA